MIAVSDRHYQAGHAELAQGRLSAAREQFDLAVNVLLESSYGGRTEPRIREHFDRLVARISTDELAALADGDGFAELASEPASIDELLAVSATLPSPPTATFETEITVKADFGHVQYDIPIPLNNQVLGYIELFQGRLHDFLQEGLSRGSKYLPMIQDVFRTEGVPLDLAYIPLIESAFKPNALSRARAKGVWQFMRGTGLENGLRHDWYIDERSDPEKATAAAARYLTMLGKMFNGDWHLAMASYNGGPGRLQRAIKRAGTNNFWSLSARRELLPRETREYVPMILAAVVIARNPARYGFHMEPTPPFTYDTVVLQRPVDLRHVAEWAGTTLDDIQALNPELRRRTTPLSDTGYALKVPSGSGDVVKARLSRSTDKELAAFTWYTVKPGDSLTGIARKLSVNLSDLADANYLKATTRLAAGQRLIVPRDTTVLMTARADRPVRASGLQHTGGSDAVPAVMNGGPRVSYRVQRGDTLSSIAVLFKTSVDALRTWNDLEGTQIREGEKLTIYTSGSD